MNRKQAAVKRETAKKVEKKPGTLRAGLEQERKKRYTDRKTGILPGAGE